MAKKKKSGSARSGSQRGASRSRPQSGGHSRKAPPPPQQSGCCWCCGPAPPPPEENPSKADTGNEFAESHTMGISHGRSSNSDSSSVVSPSSRKKSKEKRKKELPRGRPKDYADANTCYSNEYFDLASHKLEWGAYKNYSVNKNKLIGEGAYGSVYLAQDKTGRVVVVKTIKPEKEDIVKIQKEIRMLELVRGGPNIVELIELVENPRSKLKLMVFEYTENPNYKITYRHFKDLDCRLYFYKLLVAINYAHKKGIIHRDLKGANVLYNPKNKELRLIDWGFGEFYRPDVALNLWPGTRYYKAPELFLHYPYYDYSADMWSLGCMIAAVIFGRNLFVGGDSRLQMEAIARVLGTTDYNIYLEKFSKKNGTRYYFPPAYANRYKKLLPSGLAPRRQRLSVFINPSNRHLAKDDAIDLVDRLLVWDHEHRLTAREALAHPYFDPVRTESDGFTSSIPSTVGEDVSYSTDADGGNAATSSYDLSDTEPSDEESYSTESY